VSLRILCDMLLGHMIFDIFLQSYLMVVPVMYCVDPIYQTDAVHYGDGVMILCRTIDTDAIVPHAVYAI
jgi:hypothetical protein